MKKDGQKTPDTSPKRENDLSRDSTPNSSLRKMSNSITSLLAYSPDQDKKKPRSRSMFVEKLGLRTKKSSVELATQTDYHETDQHKVEKLLLIKAKIDEQRQVIENKLLEAISEMPNDFRLVQFLLTEFTTLAQQMIEDRKMLDKNDQDELDIFIFQQQPPHLIYRYCELMLHNHSSSKQIIKPLTFSSETKFSEQPASSPKIFQRSSSGPNGSAHPSSDHRTAEQTNVDQTNVKWLQLLVAKSEPDLVITLIYIANQIELFGSESQHTLFRGESLSSKLSACYINAHAQAFLNNLVKEVIEYMRGLPNWPMDYNIDANSRQTKGKSKGKILTNFTNMVIEISKIITRQECDPIIASIIALRYDLTYQSEKYAYDIEVASNVAISLFWLRMFIPSFRSNTEVFTIEPIELPIFRRVTTLLTKASSDSRFDVSDEDPTNKQLNKIIETHLLVDFRAHLIKIIENKSPARIYDFKEKTWIVFHPLLSPATDLSNTLEQFC